MQFITKRFCFRHPVNYGGPPSHVQAHVYPDPSSDVQAHGYPDFTEHLAGGQVQYNQRRVQSRYIFCTRLWVKQSSSLQITLYSSIQIFFGLF